MPQDINRTIKLEYFFLPFLLFNNNFYESNTCWFYMKVMDYQAIEALVDAVILFPISAVLPDLMNWARIREWPNIIGFELIVLRFFCRCSFSLVKIRNSNSDWCELMRIAVTHGQWKHNKTCKCFLFVHFRANKRIAHFIELKSWDIIFRLNIRY